MLTQTGEERTAPLIAFAGGGTGGHLFPALALAEALRGRLPDVRFLFFATERAIDERVLATERCDLVRQTLPALRRAPWRWLRIYLGFRRSCLLCRARLLNDRPLAVIGTGGLGSVPAVREAVRAEIPTALINPDAVPGRANRFLASSVDVIFAQWASAIPAFPRTARVVVSGCPVRPAFNQTNRSAGIQRFGLDPALHTLLVTGASQGARTVNEALLANLPYLATREGWQVLHLTGESDYEAVSRAYEGCAVRAVVLPFTDHMPDALAAADLVVARAGASTLAEITAVGRASILMPYPHHRDQHQLANARCLVRASATRIVADRVDPALNGPALREALDELMAGDQARRSMASAARRLGRGHAAAEIAGEILSLASASGGLAPAPNPPGTAVRSLR
jgi:UDP-N-acetylglucosamine--N-acetylmuramyl-(pentapeptide) pyrophosphoryl-undecaprenol N-acetylglucosamine transferase